MKHKKGGKVSDRKARRKARKNPMQPMKAKKAGPVPTKDTRADMDKAIKAGSEHAKAKQDFRKAYGQKDTPETRRANMLERRQFVEHYQTGKDIKKLAMGGKMPKEMPGGGKMPKMMPGGGKMPKYMAGGKVYKTGGSLISALAKNPKMRAQMKRELGM